VKQFVDAENENFRLFSYVNSLNGEIEKLDEQISEITLEIAKCQGEGNAIDVERQRVLKKLEHRLKTAEIKTQTYDAKYADATKSTSWAFPKSRHTVYSPCSSALLVMYVALPVLVTFTMRCT
jgi:regulator of replication initiation timing